MLNIKYLFIFFYIMSLNCVFGQNYITYFEKGEPNHILSIKGDTLILKLTKNDNLFLEREVKYSLKTNNDTLFVQKKVLKKINGVNIDETFFDSFENSKILKKRNDKLIFINNNKSYIEKRVIDSLIGNNDIFVINDSIHKIQIDDKPFDLRKLLKKPKKASVQKLTGKKAYEKYGIIGIYGVIEISDKKKFCSQKKAGNTIYSKLCD